MYKEIVHEANGSIYTIRLRGSSHALTRTHVHAYRHAHTQKCTNTHVHTSAHKHTYTYILTSPTPPQHHFTAKSIFFRKLWKVGL